MFFCLFVSAIAGSFSVPDDIGGAYVPDDTENNSKRKFKKSVNKLRDCADYQDQGHGKNGNYTIYVGPQKIPLRVFCDMTTDGGGWTVSSGSCATICSPPRLHVVMISTLSLFLSIVISMICIELTSILSNPNNFHSLEVVDRVSETQLQVGENSN